MTPYTLHTWLPLSMAHEVVAGVAPASMLGLGVVVAPASMVDLGVVVGMVAVVDLTTIPAVPWAEYRKMCMGPMGAFLKVPTVLQDRGLFYSRNSEEQSVGPASNHTIWSAQKAVDY